MKRNLFSHALAACFLASPLAAGLAIAQTSTMPATGGAGSMPSSSAMVQPMDQKFFKMAAIGGMTEIEAGKLAAAQGSSAEVKTFGQRMVDDHTKAGDDLKSLAMKKNVTLPSAPDAKHQAMLDQLKTKQGMAFDTAFVDAMKKGHAEAISTYTTGSKSKDMEIAQLATTTLPTLKDHQAHIPMAGMKTGMKTGMTHSDSTPAP